MAADAAPLLAPEVSRYLARRRVGHLATADAGGAPHVVPVCFALLDGVIWVALDEKPKRAGPLDLKRVRNVRQNPRAALVVDTYAEDWSRLGFVLLRGAAEVVEDAPRYARALAALRDKYPQYRMMRLEGRPMLALHVQQVTTWGTLDSA